MTSKLKNYYTDNLGNDHFFISFDQNSVQIWSYFVLTLFWPKFFNQMFVTTDSCFSMYSPSKIWKIYQYCQRHYQKGQEWLEWVDGLNIPYCIKYFIQSAKLDSLSCSNPFCLAFCAGSDNSQRQPTYSRYV